MNSQQDGPYGVGGWLALLVAGMLVLGPLLGIGGVYGEFAAAEHQYPALAQEAEWSSFKTVEWLALLLFCAISIYGGIGLATKRTPDAVSRAKLVLWFSYPISIVVTGMVIPATMISDNGGKEVAMAIPSLIASLIALGIWTAYLNRSKRVRNTYGLSHTSSYEDSPIGTGESSNDVAYEGHIRGASKPAAILLQGGRSMVPVSDEPQTSVDENRIYAEIANELETGTQNKGLWTRLFAECKGDETQTKVLYIKQRAEHLIAAERARLEQAKCEQAEAEQAEQLRISGGLADPRLVLAVWGGDCAVARKLLIQGVKPIGTDKDGISLLDIARKRWDQKNDSAVAVIWCALSRLRLHDA